MKYIHYGHKEFDITKFDKIKNRPEITKPYGGLWASRVESNNSWKQWCENNDYEYNFNESFIFTLNSNARILTIDKCDILNKLPKGRSILETPIWSNLDFEKLSEEYDAIELLISNDRELYFKMYGWDCDSILIMNPNVIIVE